VLGKRDVDAIAPTFTDLQATFILQRSLRTYLRYEPRVRTPRARVRNSPPPLPLFLFSLTQASARSWVQTRTVG
jgi:hypothetical protein